MRSLARSRGSAAHQILLAVPPATPPDLPNHQPLSRTSTARPKPSSVIMQLVVFNLDCTIWQPEMYQIDGPPKLMSIDEFLGKRKRKFSSPNLRPIPPGSNTIYQNKIVTDQRGTAIAVFDGAAHVLSEILRKKEEDMALLRVSKPRRPCQRTRDHQHHFQCNGFRNACWGNPEMHRREE